jgi:hypothetical protein
VDTSGGCVQCKLANLDVVISNPQKAGHFGLATYWNPHTIHTEITQTENTRSVGHDTDGWFRVWPVSEDGRNGPSLLDGNVQCLGMCVQRGVLQAHVSNSWCVHQRHHLGYIVDHQAVEQVGIVLFKGGEVEVFVDIRTAAIDHSQGSLALGIQTL